MIEQTITSPPPEKVYGSADFDKTPPEPHVIIPDRLIHAGVEAAGKQGLPASGSIPFSSWTCPPNA